MPDKDAGKQEHEKNQKMFQVEQKILCTSMVDRTTFIVCPKMHCFMRI